MLPPEQRGCARNTSSQLAKRMLSMIYRGSGVVAASDPHAGVRLEAIRISPYPEVVTAVPISDAPIAGLR